jgi:hypothetical protein
MRWRAKAKSAARWGTTAAAVAIAGAWVGSGWYVLFMRQQRIDAPTKCYRGIDLMGGRAHLYEWWWARRGSSRCEFRAGAERIWGGPFWKWSFHHQAGGDSVDLYIPLWAPFLLAAVSACFLWRGEIIAKRRRRVGVCRGCGYDRRGLVGGADAACPECGTDPTKQPPPRNSAPLR